MADPATLLSLALVLAPATAQITVFDSINQCCSLGSYRAKAQLDQTCDDISVPVKDIIPEMQATCISTMELCCTKTRRQLGCEAGVAAAMAGRECGEAADTEGESFKDCCLSCTLGIVVASMGQKCSGVSNIFGCPLEQPFTECCEDVQESFQPFLNETLDLEGSTDSIDGDEDSEEDTSSDICPDGFHYNSEMHVCDDVDECADEDLHSCEALVEECVNTVGSFVCEEAAPASGEEECPPGYTFFLVTCVDINECTEDTAACPDTHVCVNTEGDYTCEPADTFSANNPCPVGFKETGGKCEDINECMTGEHSCLESQRCDNTLGSFVCVRYTTCGTGYTLNYASGKCEDNDECALGTHNCDALGSGYFCRNIQGSFRCEKKRCNVGEILDEEGYCIRLECGTGFEPGPSGSCIDIDECARDACPMGDQCRNTMGSFSCVAACEEGFRYNKRTDSCDDVDECSLGLAACFHGASCVNTLGSHRCECGSGYHEVDGVCQDIDECLTNGRVNRFVCGIDSECQNFPGSYRCVCKPGFKHRGRSCVDIDECAEIPNICSHECANLWGSYRCHCRQGYTLAEDRRTCEDEDECESAGQCQGECHNQPGSFRCSCPPGYSLASNGRTCEDVDECAEAGEPAACTAPGTQCHNTRGGFKCVDMKCPAGYRRENSHSNRCKRINTRCRSTDFACLRKPVSVSFNVMSLVSGLAVDGNGLDLFTMQSAKYEQITTKFTLTVKGVSAGPGVRKLDKAAFRLKTGLHQATLSLAESVTGPQDIELELLMEMYYLARYTGSALARIYIYVTPYEF